jgi:outer membrane beta-barrel protein
VENVNDFGQLQPARVKMKLSRREQSMKRVIFDRLLMLVIIMHFPCAVYAQDDDMMSFSEDEAESEEGTASEEDAMSFDAEEAESAEEAPAEEESSILDTDDSDDVSDADVLGILGEGPSTEGADGTGDVATAGDGGEHPIWALQRVYVLRAGRVDTQLSFAMSMNDPYRQHQALNLGAAYYITEVLAIGINFNWYRWLGTDTELNYSVSRATHQNVPKNEYYWGGQLNFTYVPIYGKFAMFKEWILHWDVWVLGGGGFIYTRPIATIDPEYREFEFDIKFSFNVGIGGRLFLSQFLAIYLELRDYIFPEELESLSAPSRIEDREDSSQWLDDDYKLTNNVMLNIGVSLFIPFTFDYKLPK